MTPTTCCELWHAAQDETDVRIRIMRTLGARTPRQIVEWFLTMTPGDHARIQLGAEATCPCSSSPYPDVFRAMVATAIRTGDVVLAIDEATAQLQAIGALAT